MDGIGEMVTIGSSDGVSSIAAVSAVSVKYYNLQGIETRPGNEPSTLVKVTTYGNGRTKAEKVME